ncbi:MAG TPA: LuxR C-terminal-related transcriptional regulator [Novosphingobium sp.]|nr:LuxR C-terminal-related transcriptional regulator [Novosphingobium sp.]
MAISPRTVEIHRANMLNKMGANHTSEAIRIAIEAALVD